MLRPEGPIVSVCLSPDLYPRYKERPSITVVVDVFRATTAIAAALHHGVKAVRPVAGLEAMAKIPKSDHRLMAAERGGEIVEGFDLGNSPLSYINQPELIGKELVLSTTNGTQAIEVARHDGPLVTGAFVNLKVLSEFLVKEQQDVMILCAGWKGRFNLEDTLFAGSLVKELSLKGFGLDSDADAPLMALHLHEIAAEDRGHFLRFSSHRTRLKHLQLSEDIEYCLKENAAPVVPLLNEEGLLIAAEI